ncbi:ankyrin [Choiromyces venosus 120613-1]|uniref:Ankyrin n=1 Tax=Choiromyces venosus 120613-1 TaxID=1336337 RepID=A0A3N4J4S2_9PEZI|nr:ankyrin [Choiromyces venosus 120613-1]
MSKILVVRRKTNINYENSRNVTGSFNTLNNYNVSMSDKRRQILEWLPQLLASRERYQAVRDSRMDGVGDWLLEDEKFSTWHTSEDQAAKRVILCYGGLGVGKTYMSSLVIDKLWRNIDGGNVAVAYVYCDFSAGNAQTTSKVLGSVLRQVVGALPRIPREMQKAFQNAKKQVDGCGLLLPEVLEMLIKSLSSLKQGFICIDGLDEFPSKNRPKLWDSLHRVIRECPNTRLFLTGRPHIHREVETCFQQYVDMLSVSTDSDDIGRYIVKRLEEDTDPDAMDENLRVDILRVIQRESSATFLLACLNMDTILAEPTIYKRRQALQKMANHPGLEGAYNSTLDRIRQQSGGKCKLGIEALMWISRSRRPLKKEELCHALGVESGAEDLIIDNVPSIEIVLSCTLGLIVIDEKAGTVHLLHKTLQEYLDKYSIPLATAHSMMAEICLTYLNYRSVRALSPRPGHALSKILRAMPFLDYATCCWGAYAATKITESVKTLALRFLGEHEKHISALILWQTFRGPDDFSQNEIMSGLHCIAFWGITEIADAMLESGCDVNGSDCQGSSPLMWAVIRRNEGMVEFLLEREDVNPDSTNQFGRTALVDAVERGNESIVKMLLERGDVNPDSSDKYGRTPLSHAAMWGRKGVVKLLLERRDVNLNSSDRDGRTPLSHAAWMGEEGVVKLLLQRRDVNFNSSDNRGRTPLSHAALMGEEGVVKLLLNHQDVNADSLDKFGQTPLSRAAETGQKSIVKLLLERGDVNPDSSDKDGRTPLSHAAKLGTKGVIKLLLERRDVNLNSSDKDGRTPLSYAAERGREGVVKLLLDHGDVNPDLFDNNGRTPLSHAAENRRQDIVKLLLECGKVNPDLSDRDGRTPFSYAAHWGAEGVAKLLLDRGNVDPNSLDKNDRTPLSYATEGPRDIWYMLGLRPSSSSLFKYDRSVRNNEGVVRLLLERGDINPESSDKTGRTPLSYSFDNNGRSPLSYADEWGEEGVVKLLLGRGNVNPDSSDIEDRSALSYYATEMGVLAALTLNEVIDVNYRSSDKNNPSALPYAAGLGSILYRANIDPYTPGDDGRTLHSRAVESMKQSLVKLSSECPNTDGESSKTCGQMQTSVPPENTVEQEADSPPTPDDVSPRTPDDPQPHVSISCSATSGPAQEHPLPPKHSLLVPIQLDSTLVPSILNTGSGVGFAFFLLPFFVMFICLCFLYLTNHGYGDSCELFHATYGAWR